MFSAFRMCPAASECEPCDIDGVLFRVDSIDITESLPSLGNGP